MIRSCRTSAGEAKKRAGSSWGKGSFGGGWQQPPSTYREAINGKNHTLHSTAWWEDERQERFRLDIGKVIFIVTKARQWNGLPREVVLALFLQVFKTCPSRQSHEQPDVTSDLTLI